MQPPVSHMWHVCGGNFPCPFRKLLHWWEEQKKLCSSTAIAIVTPLESWWWFDCRSLLYFLPFGAQIFALLRKTRKVKSSSCLRSHNGMWFPLISCPFCTEISTFIINHKTIINFQANFFFLSHNGPCISNEYGGVMTLFSLLKYHCSTLGNQQYWEEHTPDI